MNGPHSTRHVRLRLAVDRPKAEIHATARALARAQKRRAPETLRASIAQIVLSGAGPDTGIVPVARNSAGPHLFLDIEVTLLVPPARIRADAPHWSGDFDGLLADILTSGRDALAAGLQVEAVTPPRTAHARIAEARAFEAAFARFDTPA